MTNQIKNFIEEGEEELICEVMDDYLRDARFGEKLITKEDEKEHLVVMRKHFEKLKQFISSRQISLIKMIVEMVESEKKEGLNGENLPFENSPDIYGNQRIESFKKGHNQALDTISSKLKEVYENSNSI